MTLEGHHNDNAACLNCATILDGEYCSNCGQSAHIHRSMSAVWHDFLHGVLHFDGKFWRTLPMLIFKPGILTREYIAGKRAHYISPMALFLFSIFMMFAVFSFIGTPNIANGVNQNGDIFEDIQKFSEGEIVGQIEQVKAEIAAGESTNELGENNQEKLTRLETTLSALRGETEISHDEIGDKEDVIQIKGLEEVFEGNKTLATRLKNGVELINNDSAFLFYKMKSNGYKFAWLLIPLSIPFVWFSMIGLRGYHIYDHVIFTIYSISFMTILFIVMAVLFVSGISGGWTIPALSILPLLHLYKQIKYAYQLSRLQTVLRLFILSIGIFITLLLFFGILLLLGVLS